jgi:prefoldin subunit 5
MKARPTLKQRIERLVSEANELESRAASLTDRASAKRRLAEKLQREVDEAAS